MLRVAGRFTAPLLVGIILWLFFWSRGPSDDLHTPVHDLPRVHVITAPEPELRRIMLPKTRPKPPAPVVKPVDNRSPAHAALPGLPLSKTETLAALENLLHPRSEEELHQSIAAHNRLIFTRVVDCAFKGSCSGYQSKIVILDGPNFPLATLKNPIRDDYYERSALEALETLGVSYVFSQQNSSWAVQAHTLFPTLVHSIIFQEGDHVFDVKKCFSDDAATTNPDEGTTALGCVQTPRNPHGLPAYKIFGWSSDEFPGSPLGLPWTLVSEPFGGGQTYLGFSLETFCKSGALPFIEHSERPKAHRAWIHANLETYFVAHHNVWPPAWFDDAVSRSGVTPYAALEPEIARLRFYKQLDGVWCVPRSIVELDRARMSKEAVMNEVAKTRVLVGLFDPRDISLPYEGLCMGVPFINPIQSRDESHPNDRSKWTVQNTILKSLDPPYVYNVWRHDEEAFHAALREAVENPINRYIPETMTVASVRERWASFLSKDWQAFARSYAPEVMKQFGPGTDGDLDLP